MRRQWLFRAVVALLLWHTGYAGSDIKEAKIRLDKLSDFSYEYYIRLEFAKGGILDEPQARDPSSYWIFPVDDTTKILHPATVKVRVGSVSLHIELNQDERYALMVLPLVLRYRADSSPVKGGLAPDTLEFAQDQKEYLALTPSVQIDITPASSATSGAPLLNLDFNFETRGPVHFISSRSAYANLTLSGIVSSDFSSRVNNLAAALGLKYSLAEGWYIPLEMNLKTENTQDLSSRDYAFTVGLRTLLPIPNFHLTRTQFSPFPELNVAYETVFQRASDVLGMNRIMMKMDWDVPIGDDFSLRISVTGLWDPKKGGPGTIKELFDISIDHKVTEAVSAVVKYLKGFLPPMFNRIPASYLAGFNLRL